ncbi:uncharacterized protein MAM_04180 [Metarhizium album ARSEF 1941]|uniref:Uncharacterized protein n=1 Tax=Metarhizium album (strain ARSEF 1941) TaxID=1081103 RepID=A0A0B2WP29_METAS|nr:uncharacterized protein MAM_04180 [Metarhizium album ARSEF 1941]KHN97791.1 hypothetical protein MAM_04180 [Metarhizium album ARSEF 1941]
MKYSMLSVAAFVAFSLGSPAYYFDDEGVYPADAGDAIVTNYLDQAVDVVKVPGGPSRRIWPRSRASFPGGFSADLKINEQVEVSYSSGDEHTFNYQVKPIGGGFQGCIHVRPSGCDPIRWCSGQGDSRQVTCREGTQLPIYLTYG